MKKLMVLGLVAGSAVLCGNVARAEAWTGSGKLSGGTADFFNAYDSFSFTDIGMLEFTGTGKAVVPKDVTAGQLANKYFTVSVTQPDATLELSGKTSVPSAAFLKYGPGKAVLSGGAQTTTLGWGGTGGNTAQPIAFDENGKLTDATMQSSNLTIHEGTLVIGGEGHEHKSGAAYVGWRQNKDARLEVRGGKYAIGGCLCLARGNGTKASPGKSEMVVTDGAQVSAVGFYNSWSNGNGAIWGQPWLTVDGGASFTASAMVYLGEGNCQGGLIVTNGSSATFTETPVFRLAPNKTDFQGGEGRGLEIARGTTADVTVDVSGKSTLSAVSIGSQRTGKLAVRDGSTLALDRTIEGYVETGAIAAFSPRFDDATLKHYTSGVVGDWFRGVTNVLQVGAGGLTVQADTVATLWPPLKAAGTGAKVVKTGTGALSMQVNPAIPVEVRAGEFRRGMPVSGAAPTPTAVTLSSGAKLGVSTTEGLRDVSYAADGATVAFRAQGFETDPSLWRTWDGAQAIGNGILVVTEAAAARDVASDCYSKTCNGTAWYKEQLPVDRSFELTFDYFSCQTTGTDQQQANFCCMWQNSSTGLLARATGATDPNANINPSCMIGVNPQTRHIRYGENGKYDNAKFAPFYTPGITYLTPEAKPLHFTIRYDATAKRIRLGLRPYASVGEAHVQSFPCDMAAVCGGDKAWFGFVGGYGSSNFRQQAVKNVRLRYGAAPRVAARAGGVVDLSAGGTWSAELHADEETRGAVVGTLKVGGGAVVKVTKASDTAVPAVEAAPSLLDRENWTLKEGAHWAGEGALASSDKQVVEGVTKRVSGYAYTSTAYSLDCDWTLEYDFMFGNYDGVRADWFGIGFASDPAAAARNDRPSSGITFKTTYYRTWKEGDVSKDDHKSRFCLYAGSTETAPDGGKDVLMDPVDIYATTRYHQKITYDNAAKTLTVVTDDGAGHVDARTWTNFDLVTKCGLRRGSLRVVGAVGGSMTENIASNIVFTAAGVKPAAIRGATDDAFLAFEKYEGSGSLVKTGDGKLGFLRPSGLSSLTVREGGLLLRQEDDEDLHGFRAGEWHFNESSGAHMANGGMKLGKWKSVDQNLATTIRRVRIDRDWTVKFRAFFPKHPKGASSVHADALHFAVHNDPKGVFHGNIDAIAKRAAVHWYYFHGNANRLQRMTVSKGSEGIEYFDNGSATGKRSQSFAPADIAYEGAVDVEVRYDAALKALASVLSDGVSVVTNTFADIDVPTMVGDEYARLTFGISNGGWSSQVYLSDFSFETAEPVVSDSTEAYVDALAAEGDLPVVLDTARAGGVFRLAETMSVQPGARLAVCSCDAAATLAVGELTLGAGAKVAGDNATVAPESLACANDLRVDGATLTIPSADSIGPETVIYLENGARLKLDFEGSAYVRKVFVDGVPVPNGGYGAGADWIAPDSSGRIAVGGGMLIFLR